MKKKLLLPLIFIVVISNLYSQTEVNNTTAVPYSENEFPQWLKDVRDTEIITFGSLPFVMLGVSLTYSLIDVISHDFDMSYFSNPFSIDTSLSFNKQKKILLTSSLISLGIGLTNLSINLIKRKKSNTLNIQKGNIILTEFSNELLIVPIPQKYLREKKYLYGNLESVVF